MPKAEQPDPRTLCLVCKKPQSEEEPGATFHGQGSNGMIVTFFLHDLCSVALRAGRGSPTSAAPGAPRPIRKELRPRIVC